MPNIPQELRPILHAALNAYLHERDDRSVDLEGARALADYLHQVILKLIQAS
jgi:hypothetical protein